MVAPLASSSDAEWVPESLSSNIPSMKQIPSEADPELFCCRFQHTRMGVGKENVKLVKMCTPLPCFSRPGVREAAARGSQSYTQT